MGEGTLARLRLSYGTDVKVNTATREFVTGTAANTARLDQRPPTYLDDDVYGQALDAFVPTCIDVIVIAPDGLVLLGERQQEPQPDWWVIGGRMRTRETFAAAAVRNVKRELGIDLDLNRLDQVPIGAYSLVWDSRAQEPTFDGCHMLSLPLIYRLTAEELAAEELAAITPNKEYAQVGLFDLEDVSTNERFFHPALRAMARDAQKRILGH